MGRLVEDLLKGLKRRALKIHERLGGGSYVDDAIIIQALIEGDQRGFTEQEIMDLVAVDMHDAELEGIEATFGGEDI
jgi:hypothetical protein